MKTERCHGFEGRVGPLGPPKGSYEFAITAGPAVPPYLEP
jgi:hypothetical protein